jgi:D-sedoheptulose 7-phosphate isomerase
VSRPDVEAALAEHASLVERVRGELAEQIVELGRRVVDTLRGGGKLLFCGNGGSAADAQHLAAEYVVRFHRDRAPLAALALTTDTSVLTAGGNDLGFEHVFERQVRALARHGDLLILHSTSGDSPNLLLAAAAAREMGAGTVALLANGRSSGGGALRERVDLALIVPTTSPARAQEVHQTIGHIVCELADRAFTT